MLAAPFKQTGVGGGIKQRSLIHKIYVNFYQDFELITHSNFLYYWHTILEIHVRPNKRKKRKIVVSRAV